MIRGKADVIMVEVHNKCNVLESFQNLPSNPQSVKKIVFHETGPWCPVGTAVI